MKIDFIIPGATKSGSTALSKFIGQHPQIAFAAQKECHFFDNDDYFQNEEVNYGIYHKHWSHILLNPVRLRQCKVYGESTPGYMYWQGCMERIYKYNANIKLIFILRNPIDRAYSHWNMTIQNGKEFRKFSEALRVEEIHKISAKKTSEYFPYISRGFYSQQIKRIMELFPREQMLFIKNEDLNNDHQATLNSVFKFLEVDPVGTIKSKIVNSRQYPPMEESDREFLREKYVQEIIDLENLLDWDLSNWKD